MAKMTINLILHTVVCFQGDTRFKIRIDSSLYLKRYSIESCRRRLKFFACMVEILIPTGIIESSKKVPQIY